MALPLADTLDALSQQLAQAAEGVRSGKLRPETDTFQRMGLLKAGTDLLDAVSEPKDRLLLFLSHFSHLAAQRMFIKWKAFETIPTGDASISYNGLAAKLGVDVSLISKMPDKRLAI
ncbi:hypothetical protein jhhlp_008877 [Lomentospora prolificans]|uniref:Uncharacterized protein n=1 Tax=Lomentospora prolificans TaxID=41688 RepID=A0A2N3MZ99_9PEZI|nr:hypothetical protein jhhlp_008877 [Lomentospora prolificans]